VKFNAKILMPKYNQFQSRIQKVQKFVDSEVIRKCDPYVPFKTGMLRDSVKFGTKIGSGKIRWIAPYAQRQYYKGSATGKRGRRWGERAIAAHGDEIIRGAQKKLNGGK